MAGEFNDDKKIDPQALDVECLKQAETFYKWAERSVEAKARADRLELKVEVVEAEVYAEIQKAPEEHGFDGRPTVDALKAAVTRHPRLQKAKRAHLRAKRDAALLDKAVRALEVKKASLGDLVVLHGQNYFAGPKVPRDLAAAVTKQKKITRKRAAE